MAAEETLEPCWAAGSLAVLGSHLQPLSHRHLIWVCCEQVASSGAWLFHGHFTLKRKQDVQDVSLESVKNGFIQNSLWRILRQADSVSWEVHTWEPGRKSRARTPSGAGSSLQDGSRGLHHSTGNSVWLGGNVARRQKVANRKQQETLNPFPQIMYHWA